MNKENLLKYQYPLAQFLYWVTCCACSGFVAVYLQYKGLTDTSVGIVVGVYGLISMVLQPLLSKMVHRFSGLSPRRMILIVLVVTSILFAVITCFKMNLGVTIFIFILVNALNSCMIPLMSALGMEYINEGRDVNFGIARGFGSLGWAVSSVVIGFLLEKFSSELIGYIYVVAAIVMLLNVGFMEELGQNALPAEKTEKEEGFLRKCLQDNVLIFVAIGILFNNISHALCTTYTINIVRNVGGEEAAAGFAQFFGAGSELLGMLLCAVLLRKYGSLRVLKISSVFFVVRFLFLIFAGNLPMVMIGYALQGPSAGFCIPAAVYFVNERMLPQNRIQGQAVFNVFTSSIASFIGNLVGGRLLDVFGLHFTLTACFIFAALGCVCISTRKLSS